MHSPARWFVPNVRPSSANDNRGPIAVHQRYGPVTWASSIFSSGVSTFSRPKVATKRWSSVIVTPSRQGSAPAPSHIGMNRLSKWSGKNSLTATDSTVAARLCRYEHIFAAACPREKSRRLGSQATAPRDITTDVEDLFAGVGAVEQAAHGCREIENRTALYVNEVGDLASASQIKKQYRQRLKAFSRRRFERIQPVISAGRTQAEHGLIIRWSRVRAPHAREWRAGPPS